MYKLIFVIYYKIISLVWLNEHLVLSIGPDESSLSGNRHTELEASVFNWRTSQMKNIRTSNDPHLYLHLNKIQL